MLESLFFFFNDTATTEIYTLSLHDALPISGRQSLYALCPTLVMSDGRPYIAIGTPGGRTIQQTTPQMLTNLIDFDMDLQQDRKSTRLNSSHANISYAVFCLKKKNNTQSFLL